MNTKLVHQQNNNHDPSLLVRSFRKGNPSVEDVRLREREAFVSLYATLFVDRPTKRRAPFNYLWTVRMHKRMLEKVYVFAGQIRKERLNFGIPHHRIISELKALVDNLPYWKESSMNEIEQAARLHTEFVRIHPFRDGNGRWARILTDLWTGRHFGWVSGWPDEVGVTSPIRDAYMKAIGNAVDQCDITLISEMHEKYKVYPWS